MTVPLDAPVSVFRGSRNTTPVETLPLSAMLHRIQDGTYQQYVTHLRQLLATEGKAPYDTAKRQSMGFTPAGVFTKRASAQLTTPSGLLNFDFDHLHDLTAAKNLLIADPWIVYVFVSPSGDGLKVAVWANGIADDTTYKHAWGTVLNYFERTYPALAVANDAHCKDIARLCYTSWDPEAYSNPDARLYAVPPYQAPAPKPKPTPPPPSEVLPADRRERYARQAIDTAVQMIDASIPPTPTSSGTRHETRLRAARLLGGYVAGGIVTYVEAYAALQNAVARNTDDITRSMKTIEDGLQHGQAQSITLDQLEADRLDWLKTHRATLVVQGRPAVPDMTSPAAADPSTTSTTNGNSATITWGTPGQQTPPPRPDILLNTEMTRIVDATQTALLALPEAPIIYQRARHLAVIARGVKPPKWLHRPQDMPVMLDASTARLTELASQAAHYWKYDKRQKQWDAALPPKWVIETIQSRPAWDFPPLEGIVASPTLRPDGSLLDVPGYDASTGLYLDTNGTTFPALPAHPTLDDARTAIGRLQAAVMDFPFTELWHFSATMAAMLSLVCRFAVRGNVPLFAIRANTRASGKSLLADVISLIGTGRAAPRWPQVTEDEEERKRLLTVALAGYPCLHIDNVVRPLGSPALDMALTAPSFSDRLLGKHESREAPLFMVWMASGNNMQFQGDTARRIVPIDLDPKMERPEERTDFKHAPLIPWVQQERPRLTIAALTIVQAYFEAGCPAQALTAMGSFEQWSDLIRQALVWAGEADPNEGRKDLEAESNPEYEQLAQLLQAWEVCYPIPQGKARSEAKTLKQVLNDIAALKAMDKPPVIPGKPNTPNDYDALQEALGALDRHYDGKGLHSEGVGYKLRAMQGRMIGTRRLAIMGKDRTRATLWGVEAL